METTISTCILFAAIAFGCGLCLTRGEIIDDERVSSIFFWSLLGALATCSFCALLGASAVETWAILIGWSFLTLIVAALINRGKWLPFCFVLSYAIIAAIMIFTAEPENPRLTVKPTTIYGWVPSDDMKQLEGLLKDFKKESGDNCSLVVTRKKEDSNRSACFIDFKNNTRGDKLNASFLMRSYTDDDGHTRTYYELLGANYHGNGRIDGRSVKIDKKLLEYSHADPAGNRHLKEVTLYLR